MIGSTISHYRILEKLGEGGMGVVYKAQDLDLDRLVAIKALPERLVGHDTEQQRFIQEAKAVSALNHPHVCTIHEFLKVDDRQYIVMEYVDGHTLREVIRSGMPDQNTAINYAVQIGEALEEAHSKGIVHRDVKPENIMVNSRNEIKVMDFGLAKLKGSLKLTKTSSTVGTLSYMAPEQIEGKEVDARSDIFSFGIVLYEMLSGHIPFRGEHEAALIYSILNEEPEPIERYRTDVPQDLQHILSRAMEKNPEERYQSVHEMLIELRRLKKVSTRVVRPGCEEAEPQMKKRSFIVRYRVQVIALAVIILAGVAYLFLIKRGVEINPNFTQRTVNVPFKQVGRPAISPDGNYLVFVGADEKNRQRLYIISVMGGEPRQLAPDTNEVGQPHISPDGRTIVYRRGTECEICVVPFIGGLSKKIGIGFTPKWSPDGRRIGYILPSPAIREAYPSWPVSKSGNGEFWTMDPDGTDDRLEFIDTIASKKLWDILSFAWSPDSRSVAWVRSLPTFHSEIVIHDLQSHKETRLVADTTWKDEICWGSNDQIIYSATSEEGKNLWIVPAKGGSPVKITRGNNSFNYPTISADGKLVGFRQEINFVHLWIAHLDGSNQHFEVTSEEASYVRPIISPDGKHIVYSAQFPSGDECHIYIINRDGSNRRQLTFGETYDDIPSWSPDSKFIAYATAKRHEHSDSSRVYVLNVEKFETPRLIQSGWVYGWKDTSTLEVEYQNKVWAVHLDGKPAEQFSDDSVYAMSVLNNKYVLFFDNHKKSDRLWKVCRSGDWNGKGPSKSWVIWKGATEVPVKHIGIDRNGGMFIFKSENELLRISFLDGKQERIPATFPKINLSRYPVQLTQDGMELCYKTDESTSKLGVIENLFK